MLKLAGYYEVKNIPKYANTHGPHKGVIPHIHKENQKASPIKATGLFSPPHVSTHPA